MSEKTKEVPQLADATYAHTRVVGQSLLWAKLGLPVVCVCVCTDLYHTARYGEGISPLLLL